jgi:hypothetical protein
MRITAMRNLLKQRCECADFDEFGTSRKPVDNLRHQS